MYYTSSHTFIGSVNIRGLTVATTDQIPSLTGYATSSLLTSLLGSYVTTISLTNQLASYALLAISQGHLPSLLNLFLHRIRIVYEPIIIWEDTLSWML